MHDVIRLHDVDVVVDGPSAGPTLVMVHGWPDTHEVWERQVDALQVEYRCARFTLPGYRLGDPRLARTLDDLVELVERVVEAVSPTEPVVLVLHDWGCVFGQAFALAAPDRVRGVVMFDVGDANSPELEAQLSRRDRVLRDGYQAALAAAWRRGGRLGDQVTRGMARAMARHVDARCVHAGMNYPYQAMRELVDAPVMGATISHPTLFLYGRKKPFMFHSDAWVSRLRATQGCEVAAFDAGHWLMLERPNEVDACVDRWLGALPTATDHP